MKNAKTLCKHPLSVLYWRQAAAEFSDLRSISCAAMLCALAIVIEQFQIPVSRTLFVSASFLVVAPCSMLTGPLMAIPCGVLVDVVGAILSGYEFFPGYTLTAVLSAVIYALFLYRVRLTLFRIALGKTIVDLFINVLLGSLWRAIMENGPYSFYVALSGVKNLILLPIEIFLLTLLLRALQKPLGQLGLLPEGAELRIERKDLILTAVVIPAFASLFALFAIYYEEIREFLQNLFS